MTVPSDLLGQVRSRLASADEGRPDGPSAAASTARVTAAVRAESGPAGVGDVLTWARSLGPDLVGLGPLEAYAHDPDVTDVLVNGPSQVWVERAGQLQRVSVDLGGEDAVRALAQRLATVAGRRLDDAMPFVDAVLPGGARLHAVLSPVAWPGTCVSLRTGRSSALGFDELENRGTFPGPMADLLRALVHGRLSLLLTGATGSGKTTVLAALLGLVPPSERIVVVEEARELSAAHPHLVALETRPPNVEGVGGVTLARLVREALRMRPDRLVVGEVRGAEIRDLLSALNTGHAGGFGTLHANGPSEVVARLEALGLAAGLGRAALHAQLAAGVQAVVHLRRTAGGHRYVESVAVLACGEDGTVVPQVAWSVDVTGDCRAGPGADLLGPRVGPR